MAGGVGWRLTVGLGLTQTIGYGTLYYTLGVTAPALATDLAVPASARPRFGSAACSARRRLPFAWLRPR